MTTVKALHSALIDAEIDDICAGLRQSAAKVRYLKGLGLTVSRKPNGAPLINRAHFDQVTGNTGKEHNSPSNGPIWGVH